MRLKTRFTLLFISIYILLFLASYVIIYTVHSNYRRQEFFSILKERTLTFTELISDLGPTNQELVDLMQDMSTYQLFDEQNYFFDRNNKLVYSNKPEYAGTFSSSFIDSIRKGKEIAYSDGKHEVIGFHHKEHNKDLVVIASATDKFGLNKLEVLYRTLFINLLVGIILILLISYFFMNGLFKPLNLLVGKMKKISEQNLDDRLPVGSNERDITSELAISFNHMLERLQLAFEAEKNFVRNASHEMKTPIGLVMSQIESSLNKKTDFDELKLLLLSIQDEMEHMGKLISSLLLMNKLSAKAETIPNQLLRIDEILFKVIDEMLILAPDIKTEVDFISLPPTESALVVLGNEILLRNCFLNLLENSYKYSNGKSVRILLEPRHNRIGISIRNPGNEIDPDQAVHLFEPFYRAKGTRDIKGYGLGLSIVYEIVKYHKGVVHYHYENSEHIFDLSFPVAANQN